MVTDGPAPPEASAPGQATGPVPERPAPRRLAKRPPAHPALGTDPGPQPEGGTRDLVRGLDATAAASIIIGIVIGSGIFRTPNVVADVVGASGLIFVVYLVAGILVLFGALCYAELGAMMPKSGGAYIYIREAYGELPAFLLGWASFAVTQVGSVAAVAVFFGELGGVLFGYSSQFVVSLVAASAILLLSFTNILGVRLAGSIQVSFTAFKIAALVAVILVGIYLGRGEPLTLTPVFPNTFSLGTVQLIGLAMVPALFAYDGWTNANNVAEEIQNPQKNLPRALAGGVIFVVAIYLLANFAYLWALGLPGLAGAGGETAANVFTTAFGDCIEIAGGCIPPAALITLIIFVSLFGSLNGQTIAYPRMFYAMAKDGVFFRSAALTHPRFKTPHVAILAQAAWAIVLVFSGTFEQLANYVIFASFLFYALAAAAVIVLRMRHPEWKRPYKVWGYPVTPVLFIVTTLLFTINLIVNQPTESGLGLLLVAAGIPIFYVWRHFGGGPVVEDEGPPT